MSRLEAVPPRLLVLLVILAGGVLMAFEIIGSRMLAPYFGNSVFVWGSLISVFLASLSLGYYGGGMLADRRPSFRLLCGLCLAASVLIFASWGLTPPICRGLVALGLGDRLGPLLAALAIFFVPSVLLGMVSPFAIRLTASSLGSIGLQAGRLAALSTLGSIGGTLGATFLLIPSLKVSVIVMVLGGALAIVPIATFLRARRYAAIAAALFLLGLAGAFSSGAAETSLRPGEREIWSGSSAYHHVAVVDAGKRRFLKFDDYYESGIWLDPPYPTVFDYSELFHLGPALSPAPKRALFLGAGGGVGPRVFFERYPSLERIDVIDIDPLVLQVARDYFFLEANDVIRLHAEDARLFLRRDEPAYELIVLDAFTIGGRIPFHLTTVEFFREAKARLAPGGALIMNINSALEGERSAIYRAITATLDEVFGNVTAFPLVARGEHLERREAKARTRNLLLASVRGELPSPARIVARAGVLELPVVDRAAAAELRVRPTGGQALTDEHAPIETMPF